MPLDWHISLAGKAPEIFNDLSPGECGGIQCEAGLTQPGLTGRLAQAGEFTGWGLAKRYHAPSVRVTPRVHGRRASMQCTGGHCYPEPGFSCAGKGPGKPEMFSRCFQGFLPQLRGSAHSLPGGGAPRGGREPFPRAPPPQP